MPSGSLVAKRKGARAWFGLVCGVAAACGPAGHTVQAPAPSGVAPPLPAPDPSLHSSAAQALRARGLLDLAELELAAAFRERPAKDTFEARVANLIELGAWQQLFDVATEVLARPVAFCSAEEAATLRGRADAERRVGPLRPRESARALATGARVALARRDAAGAVRDLARAAELVPDPAVFALLGEALLAAGDEVGAEGAFARARTRLRDEGSTLGLRVPPEEAAIGVAQDRLAILRDGQLALWAGSPQAMTQSYLRRLAVRSHDSHYAFEGRSLVFLAGGRELAARPCAVVRADDGQPFLRYEAECRHEPGLSIDRDDRLWACAREHGWDELNSKLTYPEDLLTWPDSLATPETPWATIKAAFERHCSLSDAGPRCVEPNGEVLPPRLRTSLRESDSDDGAEAPPAPRAPLPLLKTPADQIALSGDGKRVVAAVGKTVRVFDAASRRELGHFDLPEKVLELAVSQRGRQVAVVLAVERPRPLLLLDVERGRKTPAPSALRDASTLVFSPDESTLLARSFGRAHLFKLGTTTPIPLREFESASFVPDGRWFAVKEPEAGAQTRLYDSVTGRELGVYSAASGGVSSFAFGGTTLAVGACDGTVRLIDTASGSVAPFPPLARLRRSCIEQLFFADRQRLLLVVEATKVSAFRRDGATPLWQLAANVLGRSAVALSRDERSLAVGLATGSILIVDVATGRTRQTLTSAGSVVRAVAWSPSAAELAVADSDAVLRLVGLENSQLLREKVVEGAIHQLGYRDERVLDVATSHGTFRFPLEEDQLLRLVPNADRGFCHSPDGSYLIAGGTYRGTRVREGTLGTRSVRSTSPDTVDVASPKLRFCDEEWAGGCATLGKAPLVAYVTRGGALMLSPLEPPASAKKDACIEPLGTLTLGEGAGWSFLSKRGAVDGDRPELLEFVASALDEHLPGRVGWGAALVPGAFARALRGESVSSPWWSLQERAR